MAVSTHADEPLIAASNQHDITREQTAAALVRLADAERLSNRPQQSADALKQLDAMGPLPPEISSEAELLKVRLLSRHPDKQKAACETLLGRDDILPTHKVEIRKILGPILFLKLKDYPAARAVYTKLLTDGADLKTSDARDVPITVLAEHAAGSASEVTERFNALRYIALSFYLEKNYAEARNIFVSLLAMRGLTNRQKADTQLHVGLTYFNEENYARATPEFEKVLRMEGNRHRLLPVAGERFAYVPGREAELRLAFIRNDPDVKKVLFIGSSNSARGDIPGTVMKMSEPAKEKPPAIISGDYLMSGTGLHTFWQKGTGTDSVRWAITNLPWDVVVFEMPHNYRASSKIDDYAPLMVELLSAQKIKPVLYEIHPFRNWGDSIKLGPAQYRGTYLGKVKDGSITLAPAAKAFLDYLGPDPEPEMIDELYADPLHASGQGAYLVACCVYAAVTGQTPEGRWHPPGVKPEKAQELQALAWKVYRENNPFSQKETVGQGVQDE